MSTVPEPSLADILADPEWIKVFSTFLRRRFCFENLDFYLAAVAYEEIDDASGRAEKAMEIWMRFLDDDAASPLNIDDAAKSNIEAHLPLADKNLFLESKGQIFELLRCDSYRSFLSSKIYKDYVAHLSGPAASTQPFHDGTLTRSGNWNYYRHSVKIDNAVRDKIIIGGKGRALSTSSSSSSSSSSGQKKKPSEEMLVPPSDYSWKNMKKNGVTVELPPGHDLKKVVCWLSLESIARKGVFDVEIIISVPKQKPFRYFSELNYYKLVDLSDQNVDSFATEHLRIEVRPTLKFLDKILDYYQVFDIV